MNIILNARNVFQIKLSTSPLNVLVLKKPIYLEKEIASHAITLVLLVKVLTIMNALNVIFKRIGDKWQMMKDTIVYASISRLIMMI
jgi:hypothetical protein